jgi:class 3 adenylate cyclase
VAAATASSIAERRQISVMFCDIVGSTELATRLDPEELRDVIATYQERERSIAEHFGGFVARYMGDGLLIYFGWPTAGENDAERAVHAALQIVGDLVPTSSIDRRLSVRIGIATGLVVVGGEIGRGPAYERAVIGQTPNLAARLQALAPQPQLSSIRPPGTGLATCSSVHRSDRQC